VECHLMAGDYDFVVKIAVSKFVQHRFHLHGFDAQDNVVTIGDELAVVGMGVDAVRLFEVSSAGGAFAGGMNVFGREAVSTVGKHATNNGGAEVAGTEESDGCGHVYIL